MMMQFVRRCGLYLHGVACMLAMGGAMAAPVACGHGHEHGAHAAAGPKSGFVTTTDGVKIRYFEAEQSWTTGTVTPSNDGTSSTAQLQNQPSLLFVPGWTMTAEIWEPQMTHFAKTHRVVAMDPRGQGKSSKPNEGYRPEARARDIRAVVDQLKLQPVVLVGWSMGVMEVTSYVGQFGTKGIAGIVLVDSSAGADIPPQMMKEFLDWSGSFVKDRTKANDGFVRGMFKKPQTEAYIEGVKKAALETPTPVAMTLILGIMTTDNRSVLPKIDRPTLIAIVPGGPWDGVYVEMQNAIPGARLERFEGAGHALFVDEAEKFNAVLDEFVKGLPK